jgi:cobalt-zinc-cadmium efflux system outer membrane protein
VKRVAVILGTIWLAGCATYQPKPLAPTATASDFESRRLDDSGLRAYLETNLHRSLTPWPLKTWDPDAATLAAFYWNPDLDVARARWRVASAGVETAGGRPNPVLSAVPGYTVNPAAGVSPWIPAVNLDIPIETAGKRGHRITQAQELSEAARFDLATVAWKVRNDLRTALLDHAASRRRADLLQQQVQTQERQVSLLEQRVQAGALSPGELTLPRLALEQTRVAAADATRLAGEARGQIAGVLGVPVRALEGPEFDFPLKVDAGLAAQLTSSRAREQALLGRPDVLSALSDYAASQAALQLEVAKQFPDVHLSPGYQFDQGEHKWSLGIAVELPVLNQNQGPIAEAEARREEAAAHFVALQAGVIGEVDRALAAFAATSDQLTQQQQLNRLAHERLGSIQAQLQAGALDQLDLAGAQLEAAVADLAVFDAEVRTQQALARLENAVRQPVDGWPSLEKNARIQARKETP